MSARTGEKWSAIQPIDMETWNHEFLRYEALFEAQQFIEEQADAAGLDLDPESWQITVPGDGSTLTVFAADGSPIHGVLLRVEGMGRG